MDRMDRVRNLIITAAHAAAKTQNCPGCREIIALG